MKEILELINKTAVDMDAKGLIADAIAKGVEKATLRAIDEQFESFGNIRKQIKTAMDEGLQISTKDLPFETYNKQMLVLIKTKLGNMFAGQAAERFFAEMNKILAPAPREMPIHEFVEAITNMWKTDEPWDADDLDELATVKLEPSRVTDGYDLKLWKKKEGGYGYSSRERSPDLHLYICKEGEIRISFHQSYNPTCFREHEAFVFKLYAAGTVLTGIEDYDPDEYEYILKEDF